MTKEVTLRQAGGSVSATLPKDMADRLRLEPGDRVLAVEAMVTFLGINGVDFGATEHEVVTKVVTLAAGSLSEDDLADWIRSHTTRSTEV